MIFIFSRRVGFVSIRRRRLWRIPVISEFKRFMKIVCTQKSGAKKIRWVRQIRRIIGRFRVTGHFAKMSWLGSRNSGFFLSAIAIGEDALAWDLIWSQVFTTSNCSTELRRKSNICETKFLGKNLRKNRLSTPACPDNYYSTIFWRPLKIFDAHSKLLVAVMNAVLNAVINHVYPFFSNYPTMILWPSSFFSSPNAKLTSLFVENWLSPLISHSITSIAATN